MRKIVSILSAAAMLFGLVAISTPAQAAAKPTFISVSNKQPVTGGGQNITINGTNLNLVTSVVIDKSTAQIVSKAPAKLIFVSPAHSEGRVGITLKYTGGSLVIDDSLLYKAVTRRALAPTPYIPDSLRVGASFTLTPGVPSWGVVVTTTSKACTVAGLVVTGVSKGACALSIEITVDSMDPNWRSRSAYYDLTIN